MISPILIAMIILICVFLDRVSDRFGIPVLLGFILLGIFFGSDGVVKIPFDNYSFAEQVCSIALIFIMFYGGFGTNWEHARPAAGKAVLLSTFGVLMTAGVTGVLCHYILSISWIESFLIGALLSSTDAASVFSILRSKQLNLKYNTASLLELESGSNDPVAYDDGYFDHGRKREFEFLSTHSDARSANRRWHCMWYFICCSIRLSDETLSVFYRWI